MKRSIGGAVCAVAVSLALAGPASAAPCTPTDYVQDSHPLTAALVNPATVSGTVDATGCDIAVYFNDGGPHSVTGATIENAFYYGVLTRNPGTTADISHSDIHSIGDGVGGTFLPTGAQHGVGAAWRNGSGGSLDTTYVHQYQKNGVLVANPGTNVSVTDSTVQGLGPVMFIAQNGVQYSDHSAGLVRGNLIEDNEYTGPQNTFSTGLLLFDIEPPDIKRSLNHYRNDDRNEVVIPSSSLK
jgi:hypothetical protein